MKIHKNPRALWSIIAGMFLICIWFFYSMIDQAVTLDHCGNQLELLTMQRDTLEKVLNVVGENADEDTIRNVLAEADILIFEKNKRLQLVANQVSFHFLNGKLVKIDTGHENEK